MTRLDIKAPVRAIKTSRRCLTGRVVTQASHTVSFESSLERDWFLSLDFDPTTKAILEQPFSLYYELNGETRRYTPDVLVQSETSYGMQTTVYEIKPYAVLKERWAEYRPRFKAAVMHCRSNGWQFKIVTEREIRTPFLNNAKFLRRYRGVTPQPVISAQLLYSLKSLGETTPQALLAASYLSKETQMAAIPELWRLVSLRKIITLLDEKLTMHSPIWLPEE